MASWSAVENAVLSGRISDTIKTEIVGIRCRISSFLKNSVTADDGGAEEIIYRFRTLSLSQSLTIGLSIWLAL